MGKNKKKRINTARESRIMALSDPSTPVYKAGQSLTLEEKLALVKELSGEEYITWGSNIFGTERWDSTYYGDEALKSKGIDYYKSLFERDDKIYKAIKVRKVAVLNLPYTIVSPHVNCPTCENMAIFVRMIFENLGYSQPGTMYQHYVSQMMNAIIYGWSLHEIKYCIIDHGEYSNKIAIEYFKNKDQRKYKLNTDSKDNILQVEYKDVPFDKNDRWKYVYPKEKFVITQFDPEYGNPYGSSAVNLRLAYFCLMKRVAFDFWGIKAQKYGVPTITIQLESLVDKALYDAAVKIADNIKSRSAIVLDKSMTASLLESTQSSGRDDIFRGLIDRCDQGILNCLNLTEYGSDDVSGSGAGRAVTKQHGNIRDEVARQDSKWISDIINTQVIDRLCKLNYPKLHLNHTPKLIYPNMNMKSILEAATVVDKMAERFEFDANEFFKTHNIYFPPIEKKLTPEEREVVQKQNNFENNEKSLDK